MSDIGVPAQDDNGPGNAEFDRTLRRLVEKDGARITFVDTVYTASDLEQTENQIWSRFRHAGRFEIVSISLRPQGVLEVGVVGDLADARAALADYQDRVRVVRGAIGTPA